MQEREIEEVVSPPSSDLLDPDYTSKLLRRTDVVEWRRVPVKTHDELPLTWKLLAPTRKLFPHLDLQACVG